MNGPVECLKKLPCVDEKYCLQVTFLGPWEEWMKKADKYKYLHKIDTEILTIGYKFGWMQITQVSKIASLIHLTMFVME
jgi:hypothetical protein